jgi:hypothetical protein
MKGNPATATRGKLKGAASFLQGLKNNKRTELHLCRRLSLELELEFQFDMGNLGKEGVENCCRGMDQGFSANSQLAYGEQTRNGL